MSELDTNSIARLSWDLDHKAREVVGGEAIVLSIDDSNGFSLGVLSTIKMLQEAGVELPSEEELTAAIPAAVEAVDQIVEEQTAKFGHDGSGTGPERTYVRL